MLDPVCDMIVDVAEQREQGLTIEDPKRYIPKVERWLMTGESAPPRM